jgi:hypothetical protein
MGLVLSLALLLPIVLGAIVALRYPRVTDVTTDPSDPPLLISGLTPQLQTPDVVAEVRTAFPNALSRTYPLQPAQIYQIVGALMQARGWDVRLRRAPQTALDEGQLNAIATTLLGWRDEVSIRIRGTADGGSEVDMRSTALTDIPDLGANGMRVEEFLLALDNEVTVLMRDTPAAAEPAESPA